MCGRFRLARKKEILEAEFDAEAIPDEPGWQARYNIAPTQEIATVRQDAARAIRYFTLMRWGLIPPGAKNAVGGHKLINARAESAAVMPAFREPFRSRRCLIPADGFYEWKRIAKQKLPFCFTLADRSVFALAGLWDRWTNFQGKVIESCSILTTEPNELMREIHDRMPVILPHDAYNLWLDPGFTRVSELKELLLPYPAQSMRRYQVSQRVNHVQ